MFADIIFSVTNFIITTISVLGYFGVAFLMALQSAAIPLPSEIILPFAGVLVGEGRFALLPLALIAALGSAAGGAVAYLIGYYGGRPLILKYGRFVFLNEHDLSRVERFFARFGPVSVFFGQLLPVVRTFIAFPAGLGRLRFGKFIIFAFAGTFIWSYFLALAGMKLGENWTVLEGYFRKFDAVIVAGIVFLIIAWIVHHIRGRVK